MRNTRRVHKPFKELPLACKFIKLRICHGSVLTHQSRGNRQSIKSQITSYRQLIQRLFTTFLIKIGGCCLYYKYLFVQRLAFERCPCTEAVKHIKKCEKKLIKIECCFCALILIHTKKINWMQNGGNDLETLNFFQLIRKRKFQAFGNIKPIT